MKEIYLLTTIAVATLQVKVLLHGHLMFSCWVATCNW